MALEARQDDEPPAVLPGAASWTFSLSSVLLIITLIAVCLGVGALDLGWDGGEWGLGIALAVLAAPALLRASVAASRRRAEGQPMSAPEKAGMFLTSLCIVVLIIVSGVAAWAVTCFGLASVSLELAVVGIGAGVLTGLVAMFLMIYWLWPTNKRRTWGRGGGFWRD